MNAVHTAARLSGRMVLMAALLALLTACGLGRQLAPVSILAPEIGVQPASDWPEVDWAVQVRRPITDQIRDSNRVLVRTAPSRLQAYPGTAWLDDVPDMLKTLTIQALSDSGRFEGVGRAGGLRTRFTLASEVRRFDGVDDGGPDLHVELVVQANLISQRSGRVVASRIFRVSERSSGKGLDPLVAAFERAMQAYFDDLTPWILVEGQRALDEGQNRTRDWRERRGG